MAMFGYLLCTLMAAIPFTAGICTVCLLRGNTRLLTGAVLLGAFVAVILFGLSPLPRSLGLSRDPGYDSESLVPVVMVGAEFAAGLAVLGMVMAALGLSVAMQRK